jgi:predicted secreted Zn-dependent protease
MGKTIHAVLTFFVFTSIAFAGEDRGDLANITTDKPSNSISTVSNRLKIIEKYEYYEVQGDCVTELRSQISQKGCKWDDGKTYDSVTSWGWQWEYVHDQARPVCTPDAVTVTLEITFRYPKLTRDASIPQPLVKKWNDYLKNLIIHETDHRDMAVKEAADFSRAVAELPSVQSCSELDRLIKVLSRERMERLNADSKAYDLSTNHGLTQGAIFK